MQVSFYLVKIGLLSPILAIGLQGATPGDYAARAKTSSLAAFAVMCFASFTEIAYRVVHILT
jgi:hypothetical protein